MKKLARVLAFGLCVAEIICPIRSWAHVVSSILGVTPLSSKAGPSLTLRFSGDPAYVASRLGQITLLETRVGGSPSRVSLGAVTLRIRTVGSDVVVDGYAHYIPRVSRGPGQITLTFAKQSAMQGQAARSLMSARRFAAASRVSISAAFFSGEALRVIAAERHVYLDGSVHSNESLRILGQTLGSALPQISQSGSVTVSIITRSALPFDRTVLTRLRQIIFSRASGAYLGESDTLASDTQARSYGFPPNNLGMR